MGHRINEVGHELIVETGWYIYGGSLHCIFVYVGNFP